MLNQFTEHRRKRSLSLNDSHAPCISSGVSSFQEKRQRSKSLIKIKPEFYNEAIAQSIKCTRYFTLAQQNFHQLEFDHQKLYTANKGLVNRDCIYSLLEDNRLIGCSIQSGQNHSYLSQGHNVKGAGILYVRQGKIVTISNESGHYKPTLDEMREALIWFLNVSEQSTLLFEDHSALSSEQPLGGLRYFEASLDEKKDLSLQPLAGEALIAYLRQALKVESRVDAETSLSVAPLSSEEDFVDIEIYYECDTDQIKGGDPLVEQPKRDEFDLKERILEYPELIALTSLPKLIQARSEGIRFSRYGAKKAVGRAQR